MLVAGIVRVDSVPVFIFDKLSKSVAELNWEIIVIKRLDEFERVALQLADLVPERVLQIIMIH